MPKANPSPANPEPSGVRRIKASEFKAKCLGLMDELADSGGEIVITKHDRPGASVPTG